MKNTLIPKRFYWAEVLSEDLPKAIGLGISKASKRVFELGNDDRGAHMYVCGVTGSGKSRFLENMIIQDIALRQPLCVIDPTGMLYSKILDFLGHCVSKCTDNLDPQEIDSLLSNYLFLNLDDPRNPLQVNPLEPNDFESTEEIIDDLMRVTERLFGSIDEMRRMRNIMRNMFWVIVELNKLPVLDRPQELRNYDFPLNLKFALEFLSVPGKKREEWIAPLPDKWSKQFWIRIFNRYSQSQQLERIESSINILQYFVGDDLVNRFFGATRSTFHIHEIMQSKKNLFCYLPLGKNLKGSQLIGAYLATKFQNSAYRRSLPERNSPYYLYVDEFHEFADEQYAKSAVTLRQYGLRMINAHQSQNQPPFHTAEGNAILETIRGNAMVKVLFRLYRPDAETMCKELFELSQRQFNFSYHERSTSSAETTGSVKTVSFQRTKSSSRSWTRMETENIGITETFAIQKAKGTNIGKTLTEGVGKTIAENLSHSVSKSETKGITEIWSKQDGISIAIGEGWSQMRDYKEGLTFTQNESESLAVQYGVNRSHTEGRETGRTETNANSFTISDSQGNSLVNTQGQSIAYHNTGAGGTSQESTSVGRMNQVSNSQNQGYSTALREARSVSDAISQNLSSTTTSNAGSSVGFTVQEGVQTGTTGNRTSTTSHSTGLQKGTNQQTSIGFSHNHSNTISKSHQQSLAKAFGSLRQFSKTMSKALQESVSIAQSTGLTLSENFTQGESLGETDTQTFTTGAGEKLVFFPLEGERELHINLLQKLAPRNCVVSKTGLGAQEIETFYIPDGYFSYWDGEDWPSEILQRQRFRFLDPVKEEINPKKEDETIPFRMEIQGSDPWDM